MLQATGLARPSTKDRPSTRTQRKTKNVSHNQHPTQPADPAREQLVHDRASLLPPIFRWPGLEFHTTMSILLVPLPTTTTYQLSPASSGLLEGASASPDMTRSIAWADGRFWK